MTSKENDFIKIAKDIKNLNVKGISDLTILQAKQEQIDSDILKFIFEYLYDKYDSNTLEIYFNNTYNYAYEFNQENYVINKLNVLRNHLVNKYVRCIITDKSYMLCDVAHILSCNELLKYSSDPLNYRYEPDNALLLCRDLCSLFIHPKRYLKINPTFLTVEFSDEILNDPECKEYHKYHNKKLNVSLSNTTIRYLKHIY